jgi:hypothetical protein
VNAIVPNAVRGSECAYSGVTQQNRFKGIILAAAAWVSTMFAIHVEL